jgi:small conductance mechanosensitive channel
MNSTRRLIALAFAALLCCVPAGSAWAQFTLPSAPPAPPITDVIVSGPYVTAPILIDGAPLFRVAAPVNPSVNQVSIAARVIDVETALGQLLAENASGTNSTPIFDPRTLRVHVKREGNSAVIEAVDDKHGDPLPIVTVTAIDARASGTDVDALAAQWQGSLQSALVRALLLRQPAAERRHLTNVLDAAIVLIAVSLVVVAALNVTWKRMEALEHDLAERAEAHPPQSPPPPEQPAADKQRRRWFALALRDLEPRNRLRLYGALAETLIWALLLAWFLAVTWGLSLFAQTTPLAQTITHSALGVAGTIIVTGLLNRILDVVIDRASTAWRLRRTATSEDRARLLLRIPTIAQAVSGAKAFVLVFVASLSVVGQIGVPIGSVVTIGGLAAVALSLAAQNFIRDFLNGFLVLFEDQYVVGDFVTINSFSGTVELLTLRMVQLRDAAGDLITIPHSAVVSVVNQSRNWSRVDYRVPVDPGSDIAKAVAIVRGEIERLTREGDWTRGVATPLEWIGIDTLSKDAVIVRASIRTAPLRQFELRRLINERVHAAFARGGVTLGAPLAVP